MITLIFQGYLVKLQEYLPRLSEIKTTNSPISTLFSTVFFLIVGVPLQRNNLHKMKTSRNKTVLISGASFAGLSAAFWMNRLGYKVTVVEIAKGLKMGGTPVNIEGNTVEIIKRMGIYEQVKANRILMDLIEFKNAEDVTEGSMDLTQYRSPTNEDAFEIERDTLLNLLFDQVKDVTAFNFSDHITSMREDGDHINVSFENGKNENFDLVLGCDGIHSSVRKIWFGHEEEYSHFLGIYFSITIVDKLLIKENTTQFYNVPDKSMALNTYNNKTDIMLCFRSEKEIPYHYRDEAQQRKIILDHFEGESWRTAEMIQELKDSKTFYFDNFARLECLPGQKAALHWLAMQVIVHRRQQVKAGHWH
jgi:hypothetical protein